MGKILEGLSGLLLVSTLITLGVVIFAIPYEDISHGAKFKEEARTCIAGILSGDVDKFSSPTGAAINDRMEDLELLRDAYRAANVCLSFEKDPKERVRLVNIREDAYDRIKRDMFGCNMAAVLVVLGSFLTFLSIAGWQTWNSEGYYY
jgi:hypothetical protein